MKHIFQRKENELTSSPNNYTHMKHLFNNAGVAQVQANILTLSTDDRRAETQLMRNDFIAWMNSHFALTNKQQQELQDIPDTFRQTIAQQAAQVFEEGNTVNFYKEPEPEKEPEGKDILMNNGQRQSFHMNSTSLQSFAQLDIWITYK